MLKINSTKFGSLKINGKNYRYDRLIIDDQVRPRDYARLKEKYGTGHRIDPEEIDLLISNNPYAIIIGTGQNGVLKVDDFTKEKIKKQKIKLIIDKTPQAIKKFNQLIVEGKKVNALIHTTC